jgi:hypothetical protein
MCKPEQCLKCNQGRDCPNEWPQSDLPYTMKSALLALVIVGLIGLLSMAAAFGRYMGHPW